METAVSKRERDGRDRGVTAPNGNGGGEPRKRPRSRFAPAETDGAAPSAPSASDEVQTKYQTKEEWVEARVASKYVAGLCSPWLENDENALDVNRLFHRFLLSSKCVQNRTC